jgi:hypothetical protein
VSVGGARDKWEGLMELPQGLGIPTPRRPSRASHTSCLPWVASKSHTEASYGLSSCKTLRAWGLRKRGCIMRQLHSTLLTGTDRGLPFRYETESICGQTAAGRLVQAIAREPPRPLPSKLMRTRPMKFLAWGAAPHPRWNFSDSRSYYQRNVRSVRS